ncbi:MAG: amidase [Chloroflexi bacterium]|nr:amidase [Chloroflexota bacterium]
MTTSIAELRAGMDEGAYSARDLVQAALDRIGVVDREGPALHAVIETNPDALDIAARLDAELASGEGRGPLHGIPVLLKDNIAVTGMENTAGSLALVGAMPTQDAFVTRCLRDAGAVIIGKTNLSEWSNFRSPRSTSGWSARGGQVLNPHQLDRNPSGSSSGSGVAVAAGYVTAALGTETNGSIVSPANANGVVGIKPTVGLTSRMGVIPISRNQDTVGPMTRSVADAAWVLTAIAAADPDDPTLREQDGPTDAPSYPPRPRGTLAAFDYASEEILDANGLDGARIGVWRPETSYSQAVDEVFETSLIALRQGGAELVDPVQLDALVSAADRRAELDVLLFELAPGIAAYLERYVDPAFPIRTLEDVIAFNRKHADRELRWFCQKLLEWSVEKNGLTDPAYLDTLRHTQRRGRELGIDAVIERHGLDAIVAPSGTPAMRIDLVNGDHGAGGSSTPAALAGYPIVTVPSGSHFDLPMNISFIGGAFTESVLIRLAYAFEQATQARISPTMAPGGIEPPGSRRAGYA